MGLPKRFTDFLIALLIAIAAFGVYKMETSELDDGYTVSDKLLLRDLNSKVRDNLCLLSSIINSECSICSLEEKYLVGSVVLNRVDAKAMSIYDVLNEENQFGGFRTPMFYPTAETDKVASDLMKGIGRNRKYLYFFTGQPCWSLSLVCVNHVNWHHTFSY